MGANVGSKTFNMIGGGGIESRLEGVNRANLRFINLSITTSRVSVRNINESAREGENKSQANKE
jgi:hypothetical protein